jgi:glycosyltransferase involved in cell wall biosynthesis
MIVFNSGTRDGRVMREAHSLRRAGHDVHVVGVVEPDATAAEETLADGIQVHRVDWLDPARKRARRTAIFRLLPVALLLAVGVAFALRGLSRTASGIGALQWLSALRGLNLVLAILAGALALAALAFAAKKMLGFLRRSTKNLAIRPMSAGAGAANDHALLRPVRSRIPPWVPEFALEMLLEPFHWVGGRAGRFVLYRYRAEIISRFAADLHPDVVHCHDCMALPAGIAVKRALGIPLVYDAHEIYEAAAATRVGIVDYYARIHSRFMPEIDGFITINQSAAEYYRRAYPQAPQAVIIRNAASKVPPFSYDGRLHAAAGLRRSQKILLYHGGFTAHRGLATLVRSGFLLPQDWSLVLMGWGPLQQELEQIAAAERLKRPASDSQKAVFVPRVPREDLHLWSAGGSVGIIPYENNVLNHWICSPNKLWEFPISGVPILVQPFPELRRVVETYGCGWILPEEYSASAIASLIASLSDEEIARAKGCCSDFVDADNWDDTYERRLVEFYGSLEKAKRVKQRHDGLQAA